MRNFKAGFGNQQTKQQAEQQSNNKQITTNKNNKNIYIYFINKYKEQKQTDFYSKLKFLREIKKDKNYDQLTADEESDLRRFVMGGK